MQFFDQISGDLRSRLSTSKYHLRCFDSFVFCRLLYGTLVVECGGALLFWGTLALYKAGVI